MKKFALFFVLVFAVSFAKAQGFVTTWRTTTTNESITIPTLYGGYNYTVNWGDGSPNTNETANATHTYASAGVHTLSITGTFPQIYFHDGGDKNKILSVEQWGTNPWTSMRSAFYGCTHLVINATDTPNLTGVTDMVQMFRGATALGGGTGNWNWNTSNVINMHMMFLYANSFNQDISAWNVSQVTDLANMFYGATAFNQDISTWDVSQVTNMHQMFRSAVSFNQNIGNWNVSQVTNMEAMFYGASAFNQNIGNWNVSNVITMTSMFGYATSFNQNISTWDVSQVTNMHQMFRSAVSFNQNIGNWNVSQVTNMEAMFYGASAFNQNIGNWNVSNVITMTSMFGYATSFNQDIGTWNVSSVTNMNNMFYGVSLSTTNYDSLLTGWDSQSLQPNVNFSGGNSKACRAAAQAARAHMIASDGWTIVDGGTCINVDTTAPIVLTQDITVSLDSIGQVSITPQQVDNGTTDNSGSFTLSFDAGQGHFTCADMGPNTVTLVATDASSNFDTATAVVTVVDTMSPTVSTQNIFLNLDVNGLGSILASQINNNSIDNCGIQGYSLDKTDFTCADVGDNTVTLTVTDVHGNASTGTATVTVRDLIDPVVVTQNVTVALDANGWGSVLASQFDNGSTDACGIDLTGYSLVKRGTPIDFANLSCADVGIHTVTLQVTDNNGRVSSGTATLNVVDNILPTITGPADINAIATSASGTVVNYTTPVGLDNCTPTTTMTAGLASGSTFPIGITPVTYTVTDPSGNSASYTFNVVVISNDEDDDHDDHGDHHDDDDHSDNDNNHHNGHGDNREDDDHNGSSVSNKTKVIIYPNPVEDQAEVALNIKKKGKGEVKVYDYKGRKVFSKKVKNLKRGVKVNLRGKKTGNYYVRIKYKGKTYTATLFKKR